MKKIIFIINILILINFNTFLHSYEKKCIISDGVPNHEIGKFPTKGNPNKFKKQKLKFCFTKNPKKKTTNSYIVSTIGVTLTGIPIRLQV